LQQNGFASGEIHGDMDQSSRIKELDRFKKGEVNILVASDVAARGLDIKGVSHVFNFDTPWHPDDYVHRIGRTGRAGAKGRAFTFVSPEDAEAIANVEKLTEMKIPVFELRGGGSKDGASDRAEQPARSAGRERKPRRDEREEKAPREAREESREREDQTPREAREDSPKKPDRERTEKTSERKPARARREERQLDDDDDDDGEWNGPVPGFLGQSIS
jgi:superfamily II DNA/RNA helicase